MLITSLVLGHGKPPSITARLSGKANDIAVVEVDDFTIQSHNPQCLLDVAKALTDAAELLVREPVTT